MATQRAGGRVAARDKGCGAWGGRPRTSDVPGFLLVFRFVCGVCLFVCLSGPFSCSKACKV